MKKSKYKPFIDARKYVQKLNIKSYKEWCVWSKNGNRPKDIPPHPSKTYLDEGWQNWGDFLGTGRIANRKRTYKSFTEAKKYVRSLGLNNQREWLWSKTDARPQDIASNPPVVYADKGWQNCKDFLGTAYEYKSFTDAKKYVQKLNIKNYREWTMWSKSGSRPKDIPSHPAKIYADIGWQGWRDFLGT